MNKKFSHPFSELASKYRQMRRTLPKEVSDIAVDEFKHNFRIGGYRGNAGVTFWKPRANSKYSRGRGVLIKSGRLRRGTRAAPTYDSARVVNDVPYAKAHNEGFKGRVRVKAFVRRKGKKVQRVRAHSREMNIPARPHMVSGQPLLNNIDKHITSRITTLWDNIPTK
jgi:phage gpG-like protein